MQKSDVKKLIKVFRKNLKKTNNQPIDLHEPTFLEMKIFL